MGEKERSNTLALSGIRVQGFKSLEDSGNVELRQLTILAGANSTGKSSLMQPVLLLKQTLDASIDTGALKLDGPNVRFARFEQIAWREAGGCSLEKFTIRLAAASDIWIEETFCRNSGRIEIESSLQKFPHGKMLTFRPDMTSDEVRRELGNITEKISSEVELKVRR